MPFFYIILFVFDKINGLSSVFTEDSTAASQSELVNFVMYIISNGKRTKRSTIQGVIGRVL